MSVNYLLPLGMLFALFSWTLILILHVHPLVKELSFERVVEPILFLHTFRYIGLMFLIDGVTSGVLDTRFSHPAAYGDLIAAVLAFVAIAALRLKMRWAILSVWVFNIWGFADLVNAVGQGLTFTSDGNLGAAFWIPFTIVPLLLVSHIYVFVLLVSRQLSGKGEVSYG